MDTIEAIMTRRSIRRFTADPVNDQIRKKLLESAMQAPSANNLQPWQFVLIDERDLLNKITRFHPYASMLNHAPLAITVCGDLGIEKNTGYLALNCAAATENILLAAHSIGLGAVWLGIFPREERMSKLKDLLKLPDPIIPVSLVAIGYPAEEKRVENRFRQDWIHINGW
jgi:nitroreductase